MDYGGHCYHDEPKPSRTNTQFKYPSRSSNSWAELRFACMEVGFPGLPRNEAPRNGVKAKSRVAEPRDYNKKSLLIPLAKQQTTIRQGQYRRKVAAF